MRHDCALAFNSNRPAARWSGHQCDGDASASVLLGNQLTFTATVKNHSDTSVLWSVNGVVGGTAASGTISSTGNYTAPVDLPVPANLVVTATSHANSKKSGSATGIVQSDVMVTLPTPSPGGLSVELGAIRQLHGAHPRGAVRANHPVGATCLSLRGVLFGV